ncbi:putative GBF-interacting protein [Helianthus annuus]|uniref:GBF-interacting protein n=1 Tax=Helianthus annuus TaxID=4232 RepID=A0A251U3S1_HELAN|nr:uncharacterized protein LOC110880254 isoform X2 [Helianthus annuus]KAF5793422.1 putative GBF-interacting protein [Helianthus annuus]KAJ0528261.1 putative GBF-interacting protein [Helianthus annuus]KAJ0537180.1 putative GBF-interacting protein [Helianthus annuus]KAJ0544690.1 putative GBF-interacting protein [Helianthus annuus]KAJ0709693.1 putative GBF-interacting protein [Helianthus annuus]
MVSGSRIEGTHNLSAGVRKTIQSIKEIVGNHSDADIYVALKETNMDPNETTQKLLNQDPFHEVKRKRDKKKEVTPIKGPTPVRPRKPIEKPTEQLVQGMKPNTHSDRSSFRRAGFVRSNISGRTRQFRVVRDNRISQNEIKPSAKSSVSVTTKEPPTSTAHEKSSAEDSKTLKPVVNPPIDSLSKQVKGVSLTASGKRPVVSNVTPPVQVATKPHDSVTSPNSSVIGVYSSSSDPVHIPSLASRPAANVGAIKREIGPVGVRRHATSENPTKLGSVQATSVSNSKDHFRSFPATSKTDQHSQSNVVESVPSGRSFNNQYGSRPHQQLVTHHKAPQANKEWKPKSSQKPSVIEVGVIGTSKKSTSSPAKNSKDLIFGSFEVEPELPQNHEDQNVIIAAHIRVSETDRCRLTFGSLGVDSDLPQNVDESHVEPLARLDDSLSASSPESSIDEPSGSKPAELVDEQSSGSVSPGSRTSEPQLTDKVESSSPQNMENYTNIGMVRHSSPSYAPSETHQQQGSSELPSFSQAYDSQSGYDMSYFRPASDESLRGQVLQTPQEGFNSHVANSIPATTIPMVQQQAPVAAQMYPQVHLPHFANLMPYRQFISPVYVPPMVMPGYSNNPTYSPHPSTGNSYLMMAGANSAHVSANGLKYAIPQYKSVQAGSPTGFGNFTSPTGYALNTPGVVGSASGLDDSSRLKYKDGNIYVPNPQAETSELWMNPRDMPSMQSASYYNMAGQSPHAAYMPSHTGHASFNAAAAQSSHMQFPGLYHPPPQGAAVANAHHMGGNVGVGAGAPGTQVGYQQQPQLSQLNWTGNF